MRKVVAGLVLALGTAAAGASTAMAQTEVKMIGFGGASNLPVWVAIDKGFFAKEGLKVSLDRTPGSKEQIADMMSGKYQFASTAFDNVVAYTEGQGTDKFANFDITAIAGVHSGINSVVAGKEIKKYEDLRGKVAAVDSPTSGYATVLYQIIKNKTGMIQEKDYKMISVGNTQARVKALKDGTAQVGIVSLPDDQQLKSEGYNVLGDAAVEIGNYQGSAYAVRKSYAKSNEKEVMSFLRAMIAATDSVFADKAGSVAVIKARIKGISDADAEMTWTRLTSPGALNKRAELNVKGIETVLNLRAVYGAEKGAKATDGAKYYDLSWYKKAVAR